VIASKTNNTNKKAGFCSFTATVTDSALQPILIFSTSLLPNLIFGVRVIYKL
jgi:hypothetical protein